MSFQDVGLSYSDSGHLLFSRSVVQGEIKKGKSLVMDVEWLIGEDRRRKWYRSNKKRLEADGFEEQSPGGFYRLREKEVEK